MLRKFKCAICGCESASYTHGRYCQKCKSLYGDTNRCLDIVNEMQCNPLFKMSAYFQATVAELTASEKHRIANYLGWFPKTYDEPSELDTLRARTADENARKLAKKEADPKSHTTSKPSDLKKCRCCGEKFRTWGKEHLKHCAVCTNVFGLSSYLETIDKMSDAYKCELYRIRRAECTDEVKSITPPELHKNLKSKLNIRLQPTNIVVTMLARAKMDARMKEAEKHKKYPYRCCKCGDVYMLEGEYPEPFICSNCKTYEEEHEKGTKLRQLPGLPSMTYEHLALLPDYAACMFTKHMTARELDKLKEIKAKVKPPRKSFAEDINE